MPEQQNNRTTLSAVTPTSIELPKGESFVNAKFQIVFDVSVTQDPDSRITVAISQQAAPAMTAKTTVGVNG